MRVSEVVNSLPVEDWAASVGKLVRRTRRRIARRPGVIALGAVIAAAGLSIQTNALLSQTGEHPAPFWGDRDTPTATTPVQIAEPGTSDLVAQIQSVLFDDGAPSGVLDRRTEDEIRQFEAERGLPVTGRPSLALVAALKAVGDDAVPAVSPSSSSELDVEALQSLLNARGFGPLEVDGVMGPRTRGALEAFGRTPSGQAELSPAALALASDGA